MNVRNGQTLTVAELEEIALANGYTADDLRKLAAEHHYRNMYVSYLDQMTAKARFAMMGQRELTLDTREHMVRWRD